MNISYIDQSGQTRVIEAVAVQEMVVGTGTVTDRDAIDTTKIPLFAKFVYTNKNVDTWFGPAGWVQTSSAGAALITAVSASGVAQEIDAAGNAMVSQGTLFAGEDQLNNVIRVEHQNSYELIAASTTAGVPGAGAGAIGDYLEAVIVKANTGTITILDGAVTLFVIPASAAIGSRYEINAQAKTAWKITTPAATEAVCIGRFS